LQTQFKTVVKLKTFSELGLSDSILRVLPELGFENPSPIQEQAIPLLKEKPQDFIGLAQTGTGKTAAFGLPLLDWIDPQARGTQSLILAPTRELGQQIAEQLKKYSKYLSKIETQAVYGGASIMVQMKALKRKTPHIIIATPGRLLDLIRRKAIDLSTIKYVVLDEADEMLNMGFKEDLDKILSYTGNSKNTWLFSATMPSEIRSIVKEYMSKPAEVKVSDGKQLNENIEHQYAMVKTSNKYDAMKRILDVEENFRGVIFCRTKAKTQQLADELKKDRYQAEALHGDMSQAQRDRVMKSFKNHSLQVLVATDVAARGIDVNDLTHVVHYALPDDPSYYTHRSGRTARAGKKGISLALLTSRDMRKFDLLEKKLKLTFNKIEIPTGNDIAATRLYRWAQRILDTPSQKNIDGKLLTELQMLLGCMSFEELVEKLVTIELQNLGIDKSSSKNLNEEARRSKNTRKVRKDNDRSSNRRGEKRNKKDVNGVRFFINVGKMDGVSKRDLVDFISETANIKRSSLGTIEIQKNCAFFEVDKKQSKNIASSFNGIYVDGRELRVNRDA
jgi:ATP-dependent RNA helicase DeaD